MSRSSISSLSRPFAIGANIQNPIIKPNKHV
nr:MAG TPA: hypothetical protein [Caudoviricetes sp.]